MKKFYKQLTVNYLLNPEKWTRPKVITERSQMNNSTSLRSAVCRNSIGENFYQFDRTIS